MAITLDGSNGVTTNSGKVEVRNSDYSNGLLLNRNLDVASVGAAGVQMKYGAVYNGSDVYPVVTSGVVETDGTAGWWEVVHDGSSKFKIDSAGRVTMPYQPGFNATSSSGWARTDGVVFSPPSWAIRYNTGNHFNTATDTFTAPIAGNYLVTYRVVYSGGGTNAGDAWHLSPQINGTVVTGTVNPWYGNSGVESGVEGAMVGSIILPLSAGDSVRLFTGGTLQALTWYGGTFGIHLIG